MVDLVVGDLMPLDILLAAITAFCAAVVLALAFYLSKRGVPRWQSRKMVHISMGTVIAFTIFNYDNLTGPIFAAGLFMIVLMYAWAHNSKLITDLLSAGSRDGETRLNTFASGFMGVLSFAIVFLVFYSRPEIFVAAILAVAWGDAAGEVVGGPFGGRVIKQRFHNKSVEGSLAVLVFTTLSIVVSLLTYSPDTNIALVIPQILLVALAASIAEILSIGWTDNFLIPMVTALAMWLLLFPSVPLFPL
ncbi:MAG: hypothetical protein DRO87_11460 [Candidatus Thorarchaeota archaeon]|nr:MAG: hypothetical protein DRO87_11460 [Candidatus Thorarchaeota archaeon]RLI55115.1 MAG: hypothetical protein DRP09_10765 [Candidatus Thorarchaeota archaeon]